jgi:hypothetical protein
MKRMLVSSILVLVACLASSGSAHASEYDQYRIESASVTLSNTQAGAHADVATELVMSEKEGVAYAKTRDVVVELPPGIGGNPEAFPKCTDLQLGVAPDASECPFDSQVGSIDLTLSGLLNGTFENEPIYNMPAPGGDVAARFGFFAGLYPVFLNVRLDPETRSLVATVEGAASAVELISAETTFWGVPAASEHDPERVTPEEVLNHEGSPGGRASTMPKVPFMTNPTSCEPGRQVRITATSYQLPSEPRSITIPFPQVSSCEALEFNPAVALKPTTSQGTSGTGLDYELSLPTKGLEFANLNGGSHLRRAEVVLPKGMTVNPSQAEGLGVCSEADFARETYNSLPNVGCPESSKIGSVEAITPVIDRNPTGSLYVAKPYDNPFGSLVALYMVMKIPDRGVLIKQAGRVSLDPQTGQITTTFEDLPQLPFKTFHLHFREGARAPLVTPAACGSYEALSLLTPHSVPQSQTVRSSAFTVESGPDHGPCPSGGLPPFRPSLLAYPLNPVAGAFSPFYLRMGRTDAEQEITHFSIKLPPGLVGKLAGIPFCPEAAIAAAKARTGAHGGEEELAGPSCPAASEIGHTLAGAGVGQVLVYVPGKVYLAGPYHGSPLSIVSVTAAKAGPFDLGAVVVREALKINPETAEVFVDATGSDPIPHIIAGIPVRLRDIRVYVDRPKFVLNPTNCKPTSTASTLRGAGLDFTSEADNNPITVTSPFQVADCASLDFAPKLALSLKGGTKRGATPAFKAVLTARPGDANIGASQVTLPHSEFLEQSHIKTVCTRVQFNSGAGNGANCPAGSIYGHAEAVTPILDEPLSGPVYLRSSSHNLPDLVVALHSGKIDIDLAGRIDSVKSGRIRNTFEEVPDAPVTRFTLEMQGGAKGLLVNSTNLCKKTNRAISHFTGQNGKVYDTNPVLKAQCGKKAKKAKKHAAKKHRRGKRSAG